MEKCACVGRRARPRRVEHTLRAHGEEERLGVGPRLFPNLVQRRRPNLVQRKVYASSGEVTSLASFEIFSAAAALRARSETAGTTSPQLKAGRSPPQCCRAPLDALLCREVPKRTNTGRNLSLSAQNSPRTASQRVIFNPQYAKVVIFACEPTRTGFLSKWELELESNPYGCRREFNRNSRIFAVISCAVRPIPIPT